jgi:hypothetical protein
VKLRAAAVALLWLTVTTMAVLAAPRTLAARTAYPEGAPPGFAGGFGEQSCHACHFHAEPNSAPGRVTISGVPDRYAAGERYTLSVTLTRPALKRAGFQLTARVSGAGAQAGTLTVDATEEKRVAIEIQGDVQYASQRKDGTEPLTPDETRWSVVWTAPQTQVPVSFDVAANAADGDGTVEGDFVYTVSAQTHPAASSRRHSRTGWKR